MSDAEKDEPKLSIDEDWKETVQREKEQATKQKEAAAAPGSSGSVPSESATSEADAAGAGGAAVSEPAKPGAADETADSLPPANFDFLVTTLATQAMMALGQFPGPDGKMGQVEKPIAKHYIDLLAVLEEKTAGNLDAGEQKLISEVLHNLRMTFVAVK